MKDLYSNSLEIIKRNTGPTMNMKSGTFLKGVIALKVVLLLGIWIAMDPRWNFGDVDATAAEDEKTEEDSTPTEEAEKAAPTRAKTKNRQSFLTNLLELPTLDPESIKKEEVGRYLDLAERKKRQIEERITLLKSREDQLKSLEMSIEDKLRRLEEERKYFAQSIQREKELKGERVKKLITFFQKMEPKKAAPMFEKMDKDLVISMFKEIPQKQITTVLEQMQPDKSVELSEYFGRVRSAREYDLLKEMNKSLLSEFEECKGMVKAPSE